IERWKSLVTGLLAKARPAWRTECAEVPIALGRFYGELGPDFFGEACDQYRIALRAKDSAGRATIAAIEQLSNLEARQGEASGDADLVQGAIDRLRRLCELECGEEPPEGPLPAFVNGERASLLGSAYKRLASIHARRVLEAADGGPRAEMDRALEWSRWFYAPQVVDPTTAQTSYPGLNWLGLAALQTVPG